MLYMDANNGNNLTEKKTLKYYYTEVIDSVKKIFATNVQKNEKKKNKFDISV